MIIVTKFLCSCYRQATVGGNSSKADGTLRSIFGAIADEPDRASVQLVCLRGMGPVWHETAALCVRTNVCSWWKSGQAADTTAKTGFDPSATSARFAVMHSGVRVQRCGNVRPLSLRKGLHEATRVHLAARRRGGVARRGRRVCPCGGSVC
jgi:hypothetical protein